MQLNHRAILLLAGRGKRMGDLTKNRPKCLLEIGGVPILKRTLEALSEHHIREAILVVGYKAELITRSLGESCMGVHIKYVFNEYYHETNTAYSLWLARNYLMHDSLLLEGDILFESEVLHRVISCANGKSVWAGIPISEGKDEGVLLCRSDDGLVSRVELVREPEGRKAELQFKCAGIQLLTADHSRNFAGKLEATVQSERKNTFADIILSQTLDNNPMRLCSLEGLLWAEIDNINDYYQAQDLFRQIRP